MNRLDNYLPTVPEDDAEYPALKHYRSLGMMALLDIDFWQGHSETPIGKYHDGLTDHLKQGSVCVALSRDHKPIGYATWEMPTDKLGTVCITRQAAPFGDHLEVQRHVQARLPEGVRVIARHTRSAREVQAAW